MDVAKEFQLAGFSISHLRTLLKRRAFVEVDSADCCFKGAQDCMGSPIERYKF
jgi:hypothetical protein